MHSPKQPPIDFDALYRIDLVYRPECWKLCGDAHCCSFQRLKSEFRLLYRTPGQELPLLPGEYEFLRTRGLLEQFGDYEVRRVPYRFGARSMSIESIVSRRTGCACDHQTRTTVCRLYPFLPVVDVAGRLLGVERLGVFDMLEDLDGRERACKVDDIPRDELGKLLEIVRIVGGNPLGAFYLTAYRLLHEHVRARLVVAKAERATPVLRAFEGAFIRGDLVQPSFEATMTELADAFERAHGLALFERVDAG
jgi:hypothetical protein